MTTSWRYLPVVQIASYKRYGNLASLFIILKVHFLLAVCRLYHKIGREYGYRNIKVHNFTVKRVDFDELIDGYTGCVYLVRLKVSTLVYKSCIRRIT